MMPDTYGDMVQSLADPAWTVGGGGGGGGGAEKGRG